MKISLTYHLNEESLLAIAQAQGKSGQAAGQAEARAFLRDCMTSGVERAIRSSREVAEIVGANQPEKPRGHQPWPTWKSIASPTNPHVVKYFFNFDGPWPPAVAEAVLYKYPDCETRTVICCSTQSGCPVGCKFCGTGEEFIRNLTTDEIVDQVEIILQECGVDPSNIRRLQFMFMSMGEPMYNFDNVAEALRRLAADYPHAELLVSTVAPETRSSYAAFFALSRELPKIGLQVSVHASTDEARDRLIPWKPKLNLAQIVDLGRRWFEHVADGRRPFFNYCVGPDNATEDDADRLLALFDPLVWEATLLVVCERDETVAAAGERQRPLVERFASLLVERGFSTRVFDPAGQDDIGGGCGQLWHVQRWLKERQEGSR